METKTQQNEVNQSGQIASGRSELSKGNSILVVDDNRTNLRIVQLCIDSLVDRLDFAENGKEACEKFKSGNYSLILMDIHMPIMDGLEATRLIRQYEQENNLPQTKIIALTASVFSDEIAVCLDAGMDGYLLKPFRRDDLTRLVQNG